MHVVILHNAIAGGAPRDERDVLEQVGVVEEALRARDHDTTAVAVDLDLEAVRRRLEHERPDCVFNLVESLAGDERLIAVVPGLLESLEVPFTGARHQAMASTTNKVIAKRLMRQYGLPTPPWCERDDPAVVASPMLGRRVIVKPVWNHGSKGLDEEDVIVPDSHRDLADRLASYTADERFVELYIAGREFDVALLAGHDGQPQVLPAGEILFEGYDDERPRIVGYRAKWEPESFAYNHTMPRYDTEPEDAALIARLEQLAREAWRAFGLTGYARVDFRVDGDGQPWILEINTNPCLAPHAGLASALRHLGISFSTAVERIVDAALARSTPMEAPHG